MAWKVGTIGTTYYNGATSDGYKQYICMTYGSNSAYACYFIIFEYFTRYFLAISYEKVKLWTKPFTRP